MIYRTLTVFFILAIVSCDKKMTKSEALVLATKEYDEANKRGYQLLVEQVGEERAKILYAQTVQLAKQIAISKEQDIERRAERIMTEYNKNK